MQNLYGAMETNSLTNEQRESQANAKRSVCWTTPDLYITRLRLLSDRGFPVWDVSYCYGEIKGEPVRVNLPFSQLPKYGMRAALFKEAKATGKFIRGLFDNISTLQ
jgi:hypothetical protein